MHGFPIGVLTMKMRLKIALFCAWAGILYSQQNPFKVACVGNSITHGGNNAYSYPQQLGALLGSEYEVRNFGVGGTTMLKKGDLPYWEETAFEHALEYEPDILILMLGTNDSKPQNWINGGEYFHDYMEMLAAFRQGGRDPEIFTAKMPPAFSQLAGINNEIIHDHIIPLIDSVMAEAGTFTIDFFNAMLDKEELFPDGIHPNAEGYAFMARIAADAVLNLPDGVIKRFGVIPDVIEQGQNALLYWETTPGSLVTLDGVPQAEEDSLWVSPSATTQYTLTAQGAVSNTRTVTLQYLPPGTIKVFEARPPRLEYQSGDASLLYWETSAGSAVFLDDSPVNQTDSLAVQPDTTTTYTLLTEGQVPDTVQVTVELIPAASFNRALGQPVRASSTAEGFVPEAAVDGNPETMWVSEGRNAEWISADLGRTITLQRVVLKWGEVYGVTFHIQILDEEGNTLLAYTTTAGTGEDLDLEGLALKGRSIRLLIIRGSINEGYRLREMEVYGTRQSSRVHASSASPASYCLYPNFPNPFNPDTHIRFSLLKPSAVSLVITSILGRPVKILVSGKIDAGTYDVRWDGKNEAGESMPSGMYICLLRTPEEVRVQKMIRLE